MDILGLIVFILIASAAVTALRRAGSPARFHRAVRTRPGTGGSGRRAAATRPRKSWLVTAAKAAGVNLTGDHLGEATAELTGRTAGATVRAGHRRWRGLVGLAGRRWEARGEAVRKPLILTRTKPGDEGGADGAAKAAAAFENEFEDARDVAARGMHFTGQDAA